MRSVKELNNFFTSGRSSSSGDGDKHDDRHLRPEPTALFKSDPAPATRPPFAPERESRYRRPAPSDSESNAAGEARSRSNALAYEIRTAPEFHDVKVVLVDGDKEIAARDRFFAARKGKDGGGANTTEQGKAIDEEAWSRHREKDRKNKEVLVSPNRPGMAAALAVGRTVVAHSSVKGSGAATANHPAVQKALDKLGKVEYVSGKVRLTVVKIDGKPVGKMETWHGKCAEVGAVSNYLVKHDPGRGMRLEAAREHFQREGAEIFAHIPERSDGTAATDFTAEAAACGSCHFILTELGIRHKSS